MGGVISETVERRGGMVWVGGQESLNGTGPFSVASLHVVINLTGENLHASRSTFHQCFRTREVTHKQGMSLGLQIGDHIVSHTLQLIGKQICQEA